MSTAVYIMKLNTTTSVIKDPSEKCTEKKRYYGKTA